MKRRVVFPIPILLMLIGLMSVLLNSCKEKAVPAAGPPEIPVVKVLQKDVPVFKEFVGQVYGEYDIPIRARVSGFLEGIHFEEGRRVSKGQLLYTIDEQPFQAEVARQMSALAEAKTALVKADSDLKRYVPLAEKNAVSQSDLDAAQAQYDAAVAYVDAAKASLELAKINLGYCKMYAPIEGVIGKSLAKVGEFVGQNPNPVILNTVSQIENVRVEFFLSEADYLTLAEETINRLQDKEKKPGKVNRPEGNLELILANGQTFNHNGSIDFIGREVDPTTGAIMIQATFPNPDLILRPGLFARVKAKLIDIENALLVPQKSVSVIQGQYSVYVLGENNKVEFKPIEVGPTIGDMWVVNSGLEPSDVIILEGIQSLREGVTISPVATEFESKSEILNK